jgi:translin
MDVKTAEKELLALQRVRERMFADTRGIVIDCAKAIRMVHAGRLGSAKKAARKVRGALAKQSKVVKKFPSLSGVLATPFQEYAELEVLIAFAEGKPLPRLGVPAESYLTGVLDGLGEAKRLCMDALAAGRTRDAEKMFKRMEDVYHGLEAMSFPKSLVPGLKPKQDSVKRTIEGLYQTIVEAKMRHDNR